MGADPATRPARSSADDEAFKRELVQLIPHLRAFARTLCGDPAAADDLAQDAMMKAWDARNSFQMGTNAGGARRAASGPGHVACRTA
jgi:RNA polymerase sigma-70 factor, ECF subfamily